MMKSLAKEDWGILIELSALETTNRTNKRSEESNEVPAVIPELLQKFAVVFEPLETLPPERLHEHAIKLQSGVGPMNIRPYRYPQFQKDEVEQLVKEMLVTGIIQPSRSSFSNPVLLVKKDGSWRFCGDFAIEYKKGVENSVADALSKLPPAMELVF